MVKAFRRNESVIEAFREHNQAVYQAGVYANTYALLLMPLTNVLGNFFVIVLAGLGGWLALQGLVSVGMIATFINYGQNFINPLRQLANMYNSIQAALAGAERVFEIIDTPPEVHDAPDALPAGAHRRGTCASSTSTSATSPARPIIKDMTLEAKAGQTIALVGPDRRRQDHHHQPADPLLRDRGRADHASTARISATCSKADLRRKLGLVLQDTFLFADTVMENIRYGRLDATDEEVHPGRRDGRRRPLHPPAAAGLPDHALRAGQQPQPGPAPAAGHRPRHPGRPGHPDPGRSHQQRRHPHRGAHPESRCCA